MFSTKPQKVIHFLQGGQQQPSKLIRSPPSTQALLMYVSTGVVLEGAKGNRLFWEPLKKASQMSRIGDSCFGMVVKGNLGITCLETKPTLQFLDFVSSPEGLDFASADLPRMIAF